MAAREEKEPLLKEFGFDPSLPPDEAVKRLGEMRGRAGVSDTAVARALGAIASREAAAMLTAMEAAASGASRREIRRALFKLRRRGIELPVIESPAAPERAPRALAEQTALSALLSPIDGEGVRIVWILKARAQGGTTRLFGMTSEAEGLLGVTTASLSRRELRGERAEVESRGGLKLVEAGWELADFILCEAWRATAEARRGAVGDFMALRGEVIAAAPPAAIAHPVYLELKDELEGEPPPELLDQPELSRWKMAAGDIRGFIEEINEIRQSLIVVSRFQQEERANAVVERAIGELLAGERGARVRRRLEDTAYYLLRAGRREHAAWTARAAARLRDGADPRRSAFFQAFVRRQLGDRLAEEQAQHREEPRLVVTPAEAMRAREQRRRG